MSQLRVDGVAELVRCDPHDRLRVTDSSQKFNFDACVSMSVYDGSERPPLKSA